MVRYATMVAQPKASTRAAPAHWVLLSYRVPREPSTPRIAIWRRLKQLGVAQVGDGLVALPANDKTIEMLEWVAEQVIEAKGEAIVWKAAPTTARDSAALRDQVVAAREAEYDELIEEVAAATAIDHRTHARWRREWRRIERRDHFRSERRDIARLAIADAAPDRAADPARATSETA